MARKVSNVVRRGAVYYFRRRVPGALRSRVGKIELVRSLSTNCRRSARLLADQLFAKTEAIFSAAETMLSSDKISALVRDFYALALDIDDHRRWLGEAAENADELDQRTDFLSGELSAHKAALVRNDFEKANLPAAVVLARNNLTQDDLKPGEFNQLRHALLRATVDVIGNLLARQTGDFEYTPQGKQLRASSETRSNTIDRNVEPLPSSASSRSNEPQFAEIAEVFRQEQTAIKRWDNQTASQARATYRLFLDVCGNRPLGSYTRQDADEFRKKIQVLPSDYGKAAVYRGLSVDEVLKKAGANAKTKEVQLITQRTVKRHFSALSALWSAAVSAGTLSQNIFSGFRFANTKKPVDQRDMWNEDELEALFSSPLYSGCKSEVRRSEPGDLILRDERYWLPLIAVFSGMRQEEIAQLHVEDVRTDTSGVTYFDINDRPPRMLKNGNAARHVPIHDQLVRFRFVDYVEAVKQVGEARLFPNLKPGGADNRLGHSFSKWFTRYRRDIGIYRRALDFHSFRHTATTSMHRAGVERSIIDHVTGHSTPGETARYTKGSSLQQLHNAINRIGYGFDLTDLREFPPEREVVTRPRLRRKISPKSTKSAGK